MAKGGYRPGAGRPKGSTTTPRLRDHFSHKDVEDLIKTAKAKAEEGDTTMLRFILEQIFGKAPQSLDLSNNGKDLPVPILNVLFGDNSNKEDNSVNETD